MQYIYGVKKTEKAFFIFFNNPLQLKPQGVQRGNPNSLSVGVHSFSDLFPDFSMMIPRFLMTPSITEQENRSVFASKIFFSGEAVRT
jgi:hypothetical protein